MTNVVYIVSVIFAALLGVIFIARRVARSPFVYPRWTREIDVSGQRAGNIDDHIDRFISDDRNWEQLQLHQREVDAWKAESHRRAARSPFSALRTRQLLAAMDEEGAYRFKTVREQTRYRQRDYVRSSYTVSVPADEKAVSWKWLADRRRALEDIGFETTLREYNSREQRRLMTHALRRQIMERDNYTCQICGKYMPDEVGLHVDHIVPVARGGKTVPSNLQVLCSRCNGAKGSRV